jgi:hypothetical protein
MTWQLQRLAFTTLSLLLNRTVSQASSSFPHHIRTPFYRQQITIIITTATSKPFPSLAYETSAMPANTMNDPIVVQLQPPGHLFLFKLRVQLYLRVLWRRRISILIWLFEHTLLFLAATAFSWACGFDDNIAMMVPYWAMQARFCIRVALGRYNRQDLARSLTENCFWTALYLAVLHLAVSVYFEYRL